MAEPTQDQWARWILHRRHGNNPDSRKAQVAGATLYRNRVLDHARIADGDVVLDVGTGDGLVAFGALERIGERGRVILSDISQDLLAYVQSLAERMGTVERCQFLQASAEDLSALATDTIDVVTARSVLIYVDDKPQAFREFYRVLRPNGRLSIFEPVSRFAWPEPDHLLFGYDVRPFISLARKVREVYLRAQPPISDPMMNFDERDLLIAAERAGFTEVRMVLEVEVIPQDPLPWSYLVAAAGNPRSPTLAEAIGEALSPNEGARFTAHLRPLVEEGRGARRTALAYLWAVKHA